MITDLTSFLIISCYTKFRFGERGAQCILGEGGPLKGNAGSLWSRAYSACLRTFENLWRVV